MQNTFSWVLWQAGFYVRISWVSPALFTGPLNEMAATHPGNGVQKTVMIHYERHAIFVRRSRLKNLLPLFRSREKLIRDFQIS